MNIFEALREDHDKQRTLMSLLVKTHGDSEGREELFNKVKQELQAHAAAEERHFYAILMEFDRTQDQARHSIAEHHELDELIESLEQQDRSSSGWINTAKKLRDRLFHHLDEEEHQIFQVAGKALSDEHKIVLARHYKKMMNELRGTKGTQYSYRTDANPII